MPLSHHLSRRVLVALVVAAAAASFGYATACLRPPPDGPRALMIPPAVPSSRAALAVPTVAASPSLAVPVVSPSHRRVRVSPTRTRRPSPSPPALTATYLTRASWDRGFVGGVLVRNTGTTPEAWSVTLRFAAEAGVRIGPVWNAAADRGPDQVVLRGEPLAPGATVNAGFEASKRIRDRVRPVSCTVDGSPCVMRYH